LRAVNVAREYGGWPDQFNPGSDLDAGRRRAASIGPTTPGRSTRLKIDGPINDDIKYRTSGTVGDDE